MAGRPDVLLAIAKIVLNFFKHQEIRGKMVIKFSF
jgi:hypothetical protein